MNELVDAHVRVAQPQDAKAILGLSQQVGSETPYLTFDENGIYMTVEQEVELIKLYEQTPNSMLIVTEVDDQIVGMANVTAFTTNKQTHVAEVGICLIKEYWGYGLASSMMEMLMEFAEHSDLKVLTLEVVQENAPAIKLYENFGFKTTGTLSKRLARECGYFDSYVMEKVLS